MPRTITTLHGTDVTILGSDASYRETVAFCIDQSDAVTAVSASLRADTKRAMPVTRDITVIPNFLDLDVYRRTADPALRARFCPPGEQLVIHLSNLRPVKQVDAVVRVFARIRARVPARLLIVGEGPELGRAEQLIDELGVAAHVELIGEAQDVVGLAVGVGSVPVAVVAGKFRPVGPRGDGVRRAGRGVERRRIAGGGDRRRDGIPASARRGGADG